MPQRVHATGTADTTAIRTETFRGREYTVVPVVGLVEGVLQGLNAEEPEFASAEEFGKFPLSWNGRPVTMNHSRNAKGELTSANADPTVLEEYQMGFLANTVLDDTKLKFEAWIDNELVVEKGGEFESTLERLTAGEEMVEVSTGLFCEVVTKKGTFNGTKYGQAWSGVVPDHLALLSEGSLGACSVEDGCGAPRLNNRLKVHTSGAADYTTTTVVTGGPLNLGSPSKQNACCDACARGDTCDMPKDNANTNANVEANSTPNKENGDAERTNRGEPRGNEEGGDRGDPENNAEQGQSGEEGEQSPESVTAALESNQHAAEVLEHFAANSLPESMTFENATQIVRDALRERMGSCYLYIVAITQKQVAFSTYGYCYCDGGCSTGCGNYDNMAIDYTLDESGGVTFTGEPVPVNLIVQIIPKPAEGGAVTANEGDSGANQQQEGTADMAGENQAGSGEGVEPIVEAPAQGSENAGGDISTNATGAEAPSAPRTLEESLSSMHPDVREVVQEGIALRTQKRTRLISSIVANSNGVYGEEELKARDLADLEKLNTLCAPKADYSGRVFPNGNHEGINANSESQSTVPAAPKAFEKKEVRRGGGLNSHADAE